MEFDKEQIISLVNELNLKENIDPKDIPALDLYMDQVITLFENGLVSSKRNDEEKILTKTMINNYSKANLFMPVKNKKYSREHIILMILIYKLKQSLSITDIKQVLEDIVKDQQGDKSLDLIEIYSALIDINNIEVDEQETVLARILDKIEETTANNSEYEKRLITVLALINFANIQKRIVEKLIDTYFKK
ncbi:DUF1836 domain-containing protein [Clostridium cellulovorans]|uniref:DUF1836 domain-containing protein n=1 Tax=Clostridium cellulovorans (strain ATCC 35296 / DSM 3052 / OCM 3 / 743B) TaxID=573061 RepID=D9SNP3_CLOC7|nr:Domain of unknown function DUF1836 [Clostridium cellulovorans 743B]